jgi:hypothetical protein
MMCSGDGQCVSGSFCDNTGKCATEIASGTACMVANGNCFMGGACRQCAGDQQCPAATGMCP